MSNENTIIIESSSKENLIETIKSILSCLKECDSKRIELLLKELKDELFFYVESPYIDNHYRDTYYSYYSAKFQGYERNCLRVHIFSENITENITDNDSRYLGYFIVRPLMSHPLGKSFISPKAFKNNNFLCCLCKQTVNLSGFQLSVNAFPHVVQDEETHKCAESVIWMLLSYFGTKYGSYSALLPSDIRKQIGSVLKHRLLPSSGLTLEEITICLNSTNHNCLYYLFDNISGSPQALYFIVMRIYIESGMPFIVAYTDENDANGHVVLSIGHENINFDDVYRNFNGLGDKNWHDVSEYKKNLVFIDDNFSPYVVDNCEGEIKRYKSKNDETQGINYKVRGFIVPTHKHMYMDALAAYKLVATIFNEKNAGPAAYHDKRWITRLLLTSSKDFKHSLIKDNYINDDCRNYFLNMLMPRFIWLCEIYDESTYKPNSLGEQVCSGVLVIDVTEVNALSSVLAYYLDDVCYENKETYFKPVSAIKFEKQAYKHNLKGEWNEWQS